MYLGEGGARGLIAPVLIFRDGIIVQGYYLLLMNGYAN